MSLKFPNAAGEPLMTDITERIATVLREHEDVSGFDTDCRCGEPGIFTWCDWVNHAATAVVEDLMSWDFLMALLNTHYPEDIFPTLEDTPNRDPGPRIISLIRVIDQLRGVRDE